MQQRSIKNLSLSLLRREVDCGPVGKLSVQGLSFPALIDLFSFDKATSEKLYQAVREVSEGKDLALDIVMSLLAATPEFFARIIAHGVGDGSQEDIDLAYMLPAGVQLDIVVAVGELTCIGEGGPKKTVALIKKLIEGATNLVPER